MGIVFGLASLSLGLGAIGLFGLTLGIGEGRGPAGVPIFVAAMGLIGVAPVLALVAVITAVRRSGAVGVDLLWRSALMSAAVIVYLWWFFAASSLIHVPRWSIFVPSAVPAAAALLATPGSQRMGPRAFFATSFVVVVASWLVLGLPSR